MAITAAQVKELRERTGAGMMDCKKALADTDGDMDAAIELMRKSGQAKAEKKAGRTAADGVVVIRQADGVAVMVEVNCETDFVAKDENFGAFAEAVAGRVLSDNPADIDALNAMLLERCQARRVRRGHHEVAQLLLGPGALTIEGEEQLRDRASTATELQLLDDVLDLTGRLVRARGQCAYFVGDHCESAPGFTGTRGLDRGV